jgi:hypothetical protein
MGLEIDFRLVPAKTEDFTLNLREMKAKCPSLISTAGLTSQSFDAAIEPALCPQEGVNFH